MDREIFNRILESDAFRKVKKRHRAALLVIALFAVLLVGIEVIVAISLLDGRPVMNIQANGRIDPKTYLIGCLAVDTVLAMTLLLMSHQFKKKENKVLWKILYRYKAGVRNDEEVPMMHKAEDSDLNEYYLERRKWELESMAEDLFFNRDDPSDHGTETTYSAPVWTEAKPKTDYASDIEAQILAAARKRPMENTKPIVFVDQSKKDRNEATSGPSGKQENQSEDAGASVGEPGGRKEEADTEEKKPENESVDIRRAEFSAVAPKSLNKGDYAVIRVIMYEGSSRAVVNAILAESDEPLQDHRSGVRQVRVGAAVRVVLSSPDITLVDDTEEGVWQGDYLEFSFAVELPESYQKNMVLFTASVYVNDVIATKLKFIVKCVSQETQKITVSREDILSAFVSYASEDRGRVAAIIQGMQKARPDLDLFFDVESLRSGMDWKKTLHEEIDRRDLLYLCWSKFARDSEWVTDEWQYALKKKGPDFIEPVPIDPPNVCPPPEELNFKHFNDRLLYIINAQQGAEKS